MKLTFSLLAFLIGLTVFGQTPTDLQQKYFKVGIKEKGLVQDAKEFLYEKDTNSAIDVLKEAIEVNVNYSTPYIMMGNLYEGQSKDSLAFSYYYQAIDQIIEQEIEVYLGLFRTAMKVGRYDAIKSNLKRYKKFHPTEAIKYYLDCLDLIYDYKTWNNSHHFSIKNTENIWCKEDQSNMVWGIRNGDLIRGKMTKKGIKRIKTDKEFSNQVLTINVVGNKRFLTVKTGETTNIYYSVKEGNKWGEFSMLPKSINRSSWNSYPSFSQKHQCLFFSSLDGIQKNIYVSKLERNNWSIAQPLKEINTDSNEVAPHYCDKTDRLYFSSNGHAGLGGYDIFYTISYEIKDGKIFPFEIFNALAPINSNYNEVYYNTSDLHRIMP